MPSQVELDPSMKRHQRLSVKDKAFVKAYIKTPIAKRAYKAVHPHVTDRSAEQLGSVTLRKPEVQQALQEVLTLGDLQKELQECLDQAKDLGDLKNWRGATMDYAELAGYRIQRHEVKAVSDEETERLRQIAASVITDQLALQKKSSTTFQNQVVTHQLLTTDGFDRQMSLSQGIAGQPQAMVEARMRENVQPVDAKQPGLGG